jgi:hypothetical protein
MLEIVEFGFEGATDGVDDTAIGAKGEGGDFFVDRLEGFVEFLSGRAERQARANQNQERKFYAEGRKSSQRPRRIWR